MNAMLQLAGLGYGGAELSEADQLALQMQSLQMNVQQQQQQQQHDALGMHMQQGFQHQHLMRGMAPQHGAGFGDMGGMMGGQGGMKRMQQGQGQGLDQQMMWQQQERVTDQQRFFAQGMPMVGSGAGYMPGLDGMVGSGPGYMPGLDGMQPGMVLAGLHGMTPMQVLPPLSIQSLPRYTHVSIITHTCQVTCARR